MILIGLGAEGVSNGDEVILDGVNAGADAVKGFKSH